jgi:hypothetical protein
MYSLVRTLPWARLLGEQVPALALSFVVAEIFYKFHSFTLEALGFLATWALFDAVIQVGRRLLARPERVTVDSPRA